jgi:Sigma-70 region 2
VYSQREGHRGTPAGEPEATEFAAWVRPYLPAMARLAARIAPSADRDDVVQDALVRAWRRRSTFDPERGTPTGWLLAIVADQARRCRKRSLVAGFQPQQFRPQRVTSPYADVKVQLEAPAAVRAGSRLAFVIVLTAERGDVVLDPCPDYTILQAIDSDNFTEESFALNCPVVPYRDADGRPRLPKGVPVHFAMETTALAVATNGMKFTWGIEAPDAMSAGTGMSISPP